MIGAERYFANRYFAPRYWPKIGDVIVVVLQEVSAAIYQRMIRRRRQE